MHFVYIIYSSKAGVYYKGETENVNARVLSHNLNLSEYTRNKGPWELVYIEQFETRSGALKREKQLKRLNRRSIEKLINKN